MTNNTHGLQCLIDRPPYDILLDKIHRVKGCNSSRRDIDQWTVPTGKMSYILKL